MITLTSAKEHLRIPQDVTDEDAYLFNLVQIATEYVTGITNIINNENAPRVYDAVCHLLVAHLYANREITTETQQFTVPKSFDMLLQSIRPGASLI